MGLGERFLCWSCRGFKIKEASVQGESRICRPRAWVRCTQHLFRDDVTLFEVRLEP